ncbi:SRPBCC family protein [Algoriphagus terrigena]|uniref:SRPBCC family protein n=1 Tax=Algoriphagus terrigena TaxID=344884 RepID=UPI0003F4B111|nr:SRPBCC family protein [Algoriphagus terrigena]
MNKNKTTVVEAQMLIRKPASIVFDAFVDPAITTNFWFTKSSGRLEAGKTVKWEWEMHHAETTVLVTDLIPDRKISTEWGDPITKVDYEFTPVSENSTYVVIKNYGYTETGPELIQVVMENTGGFTTVLDGLKAYLEHDIKLNLIGDKFPKEIKGTED